MTDRPIELVLSRLPNAKQNGSGWIVRCPAHDDRTPSLSISEGDDGRVLLHCHANCSTDAILKAVSLKSADLFRSNGEFGTNTRQPTIVVTYDYTDADGNLLFQTCRMKPKRFLQRHRCPGSRNGWTFTLGGRSEKAPWCSCSRIKPVLYRLPDVAKTNPDVWVFIVEGEKDVDRLAELGLVATTNPMGAGKWRDEYAEPLRDHRVAIIGDNDKSGHDHVRDNACSIYGKAKSIRTIDLPGIKPKGDVSDWLDAGGTAEALMKLMESAQEFQPSKDDITPSGPPPRSTFRLTEQGNAERFVKQHGENVRYCHPCKSWLVWDGKRWRQDDTAEVERLAKETVRSLFSEAQKASRPEKRQEIGQWALESQKLAKLTAMLNLARSEHGVPITPALLDADPWLLNVENGTINLKTGELREHRRDDLLTFLACSQFIPDAVCPLWDKFLARVFNGDTDLIRFVQRWHGMCLTADVREQCLPVYHGQGNNGKNVMLDTITGIMGDYAGEAPPDLLTVSRNREHPTEIADLRGRRLVVASETEEGAELRLQLVKRLTGNARLKARLMLMDYFEFDRTHKMILVTNNRPIIHENTEAAWRRIRLVPFNIVIPPEERDPMLIEKLRAEWPGILAWMVRGCLEWLQEGLTEPAAVTTATAGYRRAMDSVADFIADRCALGSTNRVSSKELYAAYEQWSDQPLSKRKFNDQLRDRGFELGDRSTGGLRFWKGVGLEHRRVCPRVT